jgi:succinylglutamate desuccinylase
MMNRSRIIGRFAGNKPGPLLILTAAMHGNEKAGVLALELFFDRLEAEIASNPLYTFEGNILGIIGNLKAYEAGVRYISQDINRCWDDANILRIMHTDQRLLQNEELEISELLQAIHGVITEVSPSSIYLLDLHTTSSDGGIFCIAQDNAKSIFLAQQMSVPVVLGLLNDINGTTLHYFRPEKHTVETAAIAFESGHHDDPNAIYRCMHAIIRLLKATSGMEGLFFEKWINPPWNQGGKNLPKMVRLAYKFHVDDPKKWSMKPGYKNFQKVCKGEVLARYDGKEICAKMDGLILMPLYQKQGQDGFFIVTEVNSAK